MAVKVFKINDRMYFAGDCTAKDILRYCMEVTGRTQAELTGGKKALPVPLTPQEMRLIRFASDNPDTPLSQLQAFEQYLNELIASRCRFPCLFAIE